MRSTLAAIDNWLFLLFIAIAGLLRLLTKAVGSPKQPPNEPDESTFPRPDAEQAAPRPVSDEEQIRKFLEALGQPRTAKPPPPVSPRTDVGPRPVAPVRPPRTVVPQLPTKRQPIERKETRGPQSGPPPIPTAVYQPVPALPTPVASPIFEVQESRGAEPPTAVASATSGATRSVTQTPGDLMQLLRSPNGLQQAIILREIFGAPRGLQPLEDLPGAA